MGQITTNLSNNSLDDESPQISGRQVVWNTAVGLNYEVSFRDLDSQTGTENLSNRPDNDWKPHITEDIVVWRAFDGVDFEIMVAERSDPTVTATITLTILGDNTLEDDEYFYVELTGAFVDVANPPPGTDDVIDPLKDTDRKSVV